MEKVDAATADAYWVTRPRLSRIGAWASPQSELLRDRAALEQRFADADGPLSGRGGAASAALGRLPAGPRRVRILAGARVPTARPPPLPTREPDRRRDLAHRAARALTPLRFRNPTLLALIALGIANHVVLTGNRVTVTLEAIKQGHSTRGGRRAGRALRVPADAVRGGRRAHFRSHRRAQAHAGRFARSRCRRAAYRSSFPDWSRCSRARRWSAWHSWRSRSPRRMPPANSAAPSLRVHNFSLLALGLFDLRAAWDR